MHSSITITKLLLPFVLTIATWSFVAGNKVTVTSFDANVPDNEIVDSWTYDLSNSLIDSTINVKKSCPGGIQMEARVFQGDNLVNTFNQQLTKPMQDFEKYNLCGSLGYPDPDDESCSISDGEQSASECDLSSILGDMDPGDYKIECDFSQDDIIITSLLIYANIESE